MEGEFELDVTDPDFDSVGISDLEDRVAVFVSFDDHWLFLCGWGGSGGGGGWSGLSR